jgi:hypothetical protein
MTQEEIIEGNKLIAEFMGLHFHKIGWVDKYHIDGNYESIILDYNWSWDWLMPVVEKIYKLPSTNEYYGFSFVMHNSTFRFGIDNRNEQGLTLHTSKKDEPFILGTWLAVIEFIKWYNLKTK